MADPDDDTMEPARAPPRELPDLATRIREAQEQARQRRIEHGLPAEPDDGGYVPRKPRKHLPKRAKRHGQFLGTACDSGGPPRRG